MTINKLVCYHNCQHPDTLSMDNLRPTHLYLALEPDDWVSPWMNDIRSYQVTLKATVVLEKVFSSVYIEFFLKDPNFVKENFTTAVDGFIYRVADRDDPDFNEGGRYSDYRWLEPTVEEAVVVGPDGNQIMLFDALKSVDDIVINRGSKFDLVTDRYYDVVLPRSELAELDHISVPDLYDTFNVKKLMRQFGPKLPLWDSCIYKADDKLVTLRFIYDINRDIGKLDFVETKLRK